MSLKKKIGIPAAAVTLVAGGWFANEVIDTQSVEQQLTETTNEVLNSCAQLAVGSVLGDNTFSAPATAEGLAEFEEMQAEIDSVFNDCVDETIEVSVTDTIDAYESREIEGSIVVRN